jgi:hypothetical protein
MIPFRRQFDKAWRPSPTKVYYVDNGSVDCGANCPHTHCNERLLDAGQTRV